jgi:hypothetical protein
MHLMIADIKSNLFGCSVKNLKVSILAKNYQDWDVARWRVTKDSALFERLREQLPGWVSREMILSGEKDRLWPVAKAEFKRHPGIGDPVDDAKAPPSDEDIVVAIWRVAGGSDHRPWIFVSAAKFNRGGFEACELDDPDLKEIRNQLSVNWDMSDVRIVNEFTLTPIPRLELSLRKRRASGLRDIRIARGDISEPLEQGFGPEETKLFATDEATSEGSKQFAALTHLISSSLGSQVDPLVKLGEHGDGPLAVFGQKTSFYDGYMLYRIAQNRAEAFVVAPDWNFLVEPRERQPIALLDGTSPQIYSLNAALRPELQITESTATDYLCFFCKFVHGEKGAYSILRSADDLHWKDFPDVEDDRKIVVSSCIVAPTPVESSTGNTRGVTGERQKARLTRLATVNYGKDLFLSEFAISSDGSVSMMHDNWLIRDLPIRPFQFMRGAPLRLAV